MPAKTLKAGRGAGRRSWMWSAGAAVLALATAMPAGAQIGMFSKEQLIDLTRAWTGERFPDGRPKVPDAVLDKLKETTAEEAWGTLRGAGYRLQFEGGWKRDQPRRAADRAGGDGGVHADARRYERL